MTDYSPDTRQDRITNQWVACAPSRSSRPHKTTDRTSSSSPNTAGELPVEGCPFCPGHEEMLPSVLWQLDAEGEGPWQTRVVPNKYSALTPDSPPTTSQNGLYQSRASHGRQEVLIDTPNHHRDLAQMSTGEMEAVVHTYLARYHTLRRADPPLYPFVFRNEGARAGASIAHPHSQVIATDFPPPALQREEQAARDRYDELGRCPYCKMMDDELAAQSRLVWASDDYVLFVPYAARVPYEMWLLPRFHEPEFGRLSDAQCAALATALREAVQRLYTYVGDPDYNFFVRTALDYESDASHLHWSLRIQPRTTVEAGFERSTGIQINPSIPERDASVLRGDA